MILNEEERKIIVNALQCYINYIPAKELLHEDLRKMSDLKEKVRNYREPSDEVREIG